MKTLLIVSDSHSNSTVGLSKPTVGLDDGSKVTAATARRWLFWTWDDILKKVAEKKRGDLYAVLNGDIIETDAKDRSRTELITQNRTEAVNIGIEVFEPLMDMCKGAYVVRGTQAHVGEQAQAEEAFAQNFINVIRDEEVERASRWYLPLNFDGVRLDIAHHPKGGGAGGRPMNKMGGIMRIASDALFDYANDGEVPPHLVIRSHLHGYRDSRDAFRTRAIITPAMSLLTSYTYRIGINTANPVGAILIYCHEAKYHVEPLLYPVRKAQWETIL